MSFDKLNPATIAALIQALTAGMVEAETIPMRVVIDNSSGVPVRDQARTQILKQLGGDRAAHALSCEGCKTQIEEIVEEIVAEHEADQATKKAAEHAKRAFEAPYGANVGDIGKESSITGGATADTAMMPEREPVLYAAFVPRDGKLSPLPYTVDITIEKVAANVARLEERGSLKFIGVEIKPLYL